MTSKPDLFSYSLKPEDKCLIIASDGIWTFLSNEEVAGVVYPFSFTRDAEGAAEKLIRVANAAWIQENPAGVIDDITCIIIFF